MTDEEPKDRIEKLKAKFAELERMKSEASTTFLTPWGAETLIGTRAGLGLSQRQLAELIGQYQGDISWLESCKRPVSPTMAKKVYNVLGKPNSLFFLNHINRSLKHSRHIDFPDNLFLSLYPEDYRSIVESTERFFDNPGFYESTRESKEPYKLYGTIQTRFVRATSAERVEILRKLEEMVKSLEPPQKEENPR